MPRRIRLLIWKSAPFALILCSFVPAGHSQTTEADIKARLIGKPLYLRHFFRDIDLHFDSSGENKDKHPTPSTFTLSGMNVKKVTLKKDKLVIDGERMGVMFLPVPKRVKIPADGTLRIEIDTPANGDFAAALEAVFADGLDALQPSLPDYWHAIASRNFAPHTRQDMLNDPPPNLAGMTIHRPDLEKDIPAVKVIKDGPLNTDFSTFDLHYMPKIGIECVIGPDGRVLEAHIEAAGGLGLDDAMVAQIKGSLFQQPLKNGQPVAIQIYVESKTGQEAWQKFPGLY